MPHPTRTALLIAALSTTTCIIASTDALAQSEQIFGGGSTLAENVYNGQFNLYEQPNSNVLFNYAGVGSGAGMTAFLNNAPAGESYPAGTTIDFGASDATLSAASISAWPTSSNGNLIQLPSFGTPITIPFNIASKTSNGALALTDAQVCGIFSGKLTDFSQVSGSGLSGPIYVAYRSDNSGTSFLLTQHLAAVCTSSTSNITFTASTSFSGQFGGTVPANFHGAAGSSGVLAEVTGNANSLGYLTPDVTKIAPIRASSTTAPYVSSVNGVLPTSANTQKALANATAPSTEAQLANPAAFVPAVATPASGYPIVGFTTLEFSQCYQNATVGNTIADFVNDIYQSVPYQNVINSNGFSLVPTGFQNAILGNLYNNNNGYNLDIQDPTACPSGKGR